MKRNIRIIQLVLLLLTLAVSMPAQVQRRITGCVIDAATGDSIGFASVKYKNSRLTAISNSRGRFNISQKVGDKLQFSAVGYKTRTISVESDTEWLLVKLKPDTKSLSEVTVRAKRHRYSRKNNPAVELMRKVIEHKKKNDLKNRDYYQYMKYQKLTLAINDITQEMIDNAKSKNKDWLVNQVEKCEQTGKLILPASVEETVTQHIYRRDPRSEKDIIRGHRSEGVNDFFQTGDMINIVSKDVFTDVNIYDDQVRLLQYPFTSPIGSGAISFYRYYIEDTLKIDRDSCIHVHFLPNNQQDFGFRGDIYILKDSSYQVKRCELILPNQSDVNFVESLRIVQEFKQLPTGEWVLAVDDMIVEMAFLDFLKKAIALRTTRLDDYSFEEIPKSLFRGREKTISDPDAQMQSSDFWEGERKVELTKGEANMGNFLDGMQTSKGFGLIVQAIKLFVENFIETGKPSKVDIGPISSMFSSNFVDGFRTRFGVQTTSNLMPHLFFKGYVARGWKSKRMYYGTTLTYSLNRKKYLPDEFPKRNISFETTFDIASPSDKFLTTDKDNMFTALRWNTVDAMIFYNRQQLTFEREERWGLRTMVSLKTERNWAAGKMYFTPLSMDKPLPIGDDGAFLPTTSYRTTELKAELEYQPGALFVNTKQRRLKGNYDAPIFKLSHTIGLNGIFGGDYTSNYTEASIYKRFWLNSWGRIDVFTRAGIQWNQVPFPLLCMPAANQSYISARQTFNLLTNMEFLNDRFVSLDMNWDMQGKIFNRIPLLKKLHWREYISAKMLWGGLSDKNNPYLPENAGSTRLMYFPEQSRLMNPKVPYWEISIGVRSIFRFFQVEYVRRMNYNDFSGVHKHGVRFGFTMMF